MKKKILIIALSFVVLASTIAGATTAYFTDTDKATNVFTVGKLDITLTEECTDRDDNPLTPTVEDGFNVYTFGNLYPGQDYGKKVTITNVGTEDAYIGATITITSDSTIGALLKDETAIREFLSGLVNAGYAISGMENIEATAKVITLVITKKDALVYDSNAGETAVVLMNKIDVNKDWDNAEMEMLGNINIVVKAYAVQTVGFANAADALNAAFKADTGVTFPAAN